MEECGKPAASGVRLRGLLLGLAFAGTAGLAAPAGAATTGDPDKGEALYSRCIACHALAYDRTGPRHCGLLGRRAGSVAGFEYSKAMKGSAIVWTTATLNTFLANPMKSMPGTAMGYAGVTDPQERADLVAYLAQASGSAACETAK